MRTSAALLLLSAVIASSAPLPPPSSGTQYLFVTSTKTAATNSDISYYNTFVQNLANAAGVGNTVGLTWRAVVSTATVDAKVNAPSTGKVTLLNGTVLKSSGGLYGGSLLASPGLTETFTSITGLDNYVWTGSDENGVAWPDRQLGTSFAVEGDLGRPGVNWARFGATATTLDNRLYAITYTAPETAPEPGFYAVVSLGFAGLLWAHRRRARKT